MRDLHLKRLHLFGAAVLLAAQLPAQTPAPTPAPAAPDPRPGAERELAPRAEPRPALPARAPRAPRAPHAVSEGGYLGVELLDLTSELRAHFGAPAEEGVMISRVVAGSPAAKAGLQVADIVVGVGGSKVHDSWELSGEIWRRGDGEKVGLDLVRGGKARHVEVGIERRSREGVDVGRWILPRSPEPPGPPRGAREGWMPDVPPLPELTPALERLGRLLESEEMQKRMQEIQGRVDRELEERMRELEFRLQELETKLREETGKH